VQTSAGDAFRLGDHDAPGGGKLAIGSRRRRSLMPPRQLGNGQVGSN